MVENGNEEKSLLAVDALTVTPLDQQQDIWPMKNVPDELYEQMFGQPEPTEAEVAHYGGIEDVPPMHTYAILDAGKFHSGLNELEDCGLPFRCLFKGVAALDQVDVAPYLFEISYESALTRRLFTHLPNVPETMTTAHVWHREPGVFIRSRDKFEDIWKHFRKFTKVQNQAGKWYFLRFWEPLTLPALIEGQALDCAVTLMTDTSLLGQVWICPNHDRKQVLICRRGDAQKSFTRTIPKVTPEVLSALDRAVEARRIDLDISMARSRLSSDALTKGLPEKDLLEASLKGLSLLGFTSPAKRQDALRLYIESFYIGKQNEASGILNQKEQGPAIRLWHLKNLIEGSTL